MASNGIYQGDHISIDLFLFAAGCDRGPNIRNKLLKVLDMTLNVEMIDSVNQGEASLSWSDFRSMYRNISVV